MATFDQNLRQIKTAVYGEDVRTAIHDSIQQIHEMEYNTAQEALNAANAANTAAKNAEKAGKDADSIVKSGIEILKEVDDATTEAVKAARNATDATKAANDAAIRAEKAATQLGYEKKFVDALPSVSQMDPNIIYFVPDKNFDQNSIYYMWILDDGKQKLIGTTATDLSDYITYDYINDLEIGGTNILRGSNNRDRFINTGDGDWAKGTLGSTTTDTVTVSMFDVDDCPDPFINIGYRVRGIKGDVQYKNIAQRLIPFRPNYKYTASAYVRCENIDSVRIQIYNSNTGKQTYKVFYDLDYPKWTKISFTFTIQESEKDDRLNFNIQFYGIHEESVGECCGLRIEVGEKATNGWLSSPDENQNIYEGAGYHNSVYRGRNLGYRVTDEQYSQIKNGTFNDLFIGDYWRINEKNWRIAAFDYYYNSGGIEACTTHHVVIVPDNSLVIGEQMNATGTTSTGYYGSKMYSENFGSNGEIVRWIESIFEPEHIMEHYTRLTNKVTDGNPTDSTWYKEKATLMTEENVFGSRIFSKASYGNTVPSLYTNDVTQYRLFAYRPDLIITRGQAYWLRDVVSNTDFAGVAGSGTPTHFNAFDTAGGIRPAFCLKG